MLAPGDLTTDLFCFGHLNKHIVRHSSGPKDLTCLTNKIVKVCELKNSPPLIMSLNTHYNHIIRKPSCFTESMPKDPKDAWKVCPGFKSVISISHVPCCLSNKTLQFSSKSCASPALLIRCFLKNTFHYKFKNCHYHTLFTPP